MNTTIRRLFCFPVTIKIFLRDNNIQNVDTFHRHNLIAQCTRWSIAMVFIGI